MKIIWARGVLILPFCPRCGTENEPETLFCKNCGSSMTGERRRYRSWERGEKYEKQEKEEKQEKHEKQEKEEKHEKQEASALGQLVFGLIVICVGIMFYITVNNIVPARRAWPYFAIIVGIVVIVLTVFGSRVALKRHPRP